jgi:hypothetical protein
LLSALVGVAAAWPLLLVGIAFPRLATFALAFVPLSHHVPTWIARLVWIALALLAPIVVGLVVAAKAPPASPPEPFVTRMLRGFPITLGIAGAFLVMFVTVPVLQIASIARGRKDEHVACITEGDDYEKVASQVENLIQKHQLGAVRTEPSWWLAGPSKMLQKLGGKALRGFIPDRLAYWRGADLEIAFYPSDILVRGRNERTAWAHGLLSEALVHGPCLQTFHPNAQDLERQIRQVWAVYDENPEAHRGARALRSRLAEIVGDLAKSKIDYDDWQVVYRQTLQLGRALEGEPQVLQWAAGPGEVKMEDELESAANRDGRPLGGASTSELLSHLAKGTAELVKAEVQLAKAELRQDAKREVQMVAGLGMSGILGTVTLTLLFVAAALGLSASMPEWAATLVMAGVALVLTAIAALVGWMRRVKKPLEKTEQTLKEDVRWAKERLT